MLLTEKVEISPSMFSLNLLKWNDVESYSIYRICIIIDWKLICGRIL